MAATQLLYTTQPTGYTPEELLATMPVIAAKDGGGVTDATFTGQVALTLSAGSKGRFLFPTEPIRTTHTIQAGSTATVLNISPGISFPDSMGTASYAGKNFTAQKISGVHAFQPGQIIASNTGSTTITLAAPLLEVPTPGETIAIYSGVVFDTVYCTAVAGVISPSGLGLMGYGNLSIVASYAGLTSATSTAMASTGAYALDGVGAQYPAELPRTTPTKTAIASFGATYVETAATLPARIAAIRAIGGSGDYKIRVADGETINTQVSIPAHSGGSSGWIQIESSSLPAVLGTRVTAVDFTTQAVFETLDTQPIIALADASHKVRLVGLHIRRAAANVSASVTSLVKFGSGDSQSLHSQFSIGCKMERCYVHGSDTAVVRAGVRADADDVAIFDCAITDIHEVGADAQAVAGTNGGVGLLLENNLLKAGGENFMFGGADPTMVGGVPSDITIRRNHCIVPLIWQNQPGLRSLGAAWQTKNLGELKNARRVLIEGNVFQQMFVGSQDGTAILFTAVNQSGTASNSGVRDATFRRNVVMTAGGGCSQSANNSEAGGGIVSLQRLAIYGNLFDNISYGDNPAIDAQRMFLIGGAVRDCTIDHNTFRKGAGGHTRALAFALAATVRFVYTNNISSADYGITGDAVAPGNSALATYAPGGVFSKNVLIEVPDTSSYPTAPSMYYQTTNAGVGWANATPPADYTTVDPVILCTRLTLVPGSTYSASGSTPATDGADIGANMTTLAAAISGVGTPGFVPFLPAMTALSGSPFSSGVY